MRTDRITSSFFRYWIALAAVASAGGSLAAEAIEEFAIEPGKTFEIAWQGLKQPIVVSLPSDIEGKGETPSTLPLLFWYHGTNGRPTVEFIRRHAGENEWVIVGMAFLESGRYQYSPDSLKKEIEVYQAVRRSLSQRLPIDGARTFSGGFSKGGWIAALFGEKDPTLAGALVMGAGVFVRPGEETPSRFPNRKTIYIGIGESDGNFAMSHRARRHFETLGAGVTVDTWPGLGHQMPRDSESLRQWLRMAARPIDPTGSDRRTDPVQSEAVEWFAGELKRITADEALSHIDRYLELKKLGAAPFASLLDEQTRREAQAFFAEVAALPELKNEIEAETRFRAILEKESKNLDLGNLVECHQQYIRLAKEFPDTQFGNRARECEIRTGKLMERSSAKR